MAKNKFKLIAVDFDGTLLKNDKTISAYTRRILVKAHKEGIIIVPCTGRILKALPENIMSLGIVDYCITCNGANVIDIKENKSIGNSFVPNDLTIRTMEYMKTLNSYYDCYAYEFGYVSKYYLDNLETYVGDKIIQDLITRTRTAVDDLIEYVRDNSVETEKMQMFFKDETERVAAIEGLRSNFPDLVVTSSLKNNIEINYKSANKGEGIRKLCEHLGIGLDEVITFGDSYNDESMLDIGCFGVVMGNGDYDLKKKADYIADTNENDGVAKAINELILKKTAHQ